MDKIAEFKEFVKEKPELISYVHSGEMTWQKFYEIYDLYGTKKEAWEPYQKKVEVAKASSFGVGELLGWLKSVDLDSVQNGINSMQRVLGVLQDFGAKDGVEKPEYTPRPLYKHFED